MLFDDTYKEIQSPSKSIYREKGSKFYAYAYPVYSKENINQKLKELKQIESSANHHCYAYVLHPDKSEKRMNDDGEPNGTAGRPILKQIENNQLTNTLIVVVRYFGGIKLGIPGLLRAYKTVASDVIKNCIIVDKIIKERYTIQFNHEEMNNVMRIIKNYDLEIINTDFSIDNKLTFLVPKQKSNVILNKLKANHKINIDFTSI